MFGSHTVGSTAITAPVQRARPRSLSPLIGAVAVLHPGPDKKLGARGYGEASAGPGHRSARSMARLEQADARALVPTRGLYFGTIVPDPVPEFG
jgi:hypothetical protein